MKTNVNIEIVRGKHKKAYSRKVKFYTPKKNGTEWWIMSGEFKPGEEPIDFQYLNSIEGYLLAKGKTRAEAWLNAASNSIFIP